MVYFCLFTLSCAPDLDLKEKPRPKGPLQDRNVTETVFVAYEMIKKEITQGPVP